MIERYRLHRGNPVAVFRITPDLVTAKENTATADELFNDLIPATNATPHAGPAAHYRVTGLCARREASSASISLFSSAR